MVPRIDVGCVLGCAGPGGGSARHAVAAAQLVCVELVLRAEPARAAVPAVVHAAVRCHLGSSELCLLVSKPPSRLSAT